MRGQRILPLQIVFFQGRQPCLLGTNKEEMTRSPALETPVPSLCSLGPLSCWRAGSYLSSTRPALSTALSTGAWPVL